MSLQSWLNEYYSLEPFSERATCSDETAIQHSLKKWKGTLKPNLKKHSVQYRNYAIFDEAGNVFNFYSNTCSLCYRYDRNTTNRDDCFSESLKQVCPIVRFRGYACDELPDRNYGNKFNHTTWDEVENNPFEMVKLLHRVKRFIETEQGV